MGFRMTASDCELLSMVVEYRLITIPQLAVLLSRNAKGLQKRVSQLIAEGLLAETARGPGQRRGRPERVVSIREQGVQILQERKLIDVQMPLEVALGDGVLSQAHQLLLNWIRVHLHHLETVVSGLSVRFLAHNSPFLPAGFSSLSVITDPALDPVGPQKIANPKPDAAFAISDTTRDKTVLFFLEADRGTETVASPRRKATDIRQKILNYGICFDTHAYKKYEELWGCQLNGFRLLFITDSIARLSLLCSLVQAMPPSDYIWLTVADRMFEDGVSAEIWARGGRFDASPQSILGRLRCRAPLP